MGAQCGGMGFGGPPCCSQGLTCLQISAAYAHCVPSTAVVVTPRPTMSMPLRPPASGPEALLATGVVSVADSEAMSVRPRVSDPSQRLILGASGGPSSGQVLC